MAQCHAAGTCADSSRCVLLGGVSTVEENSRHSLFFHSLWLCCDCESDHSDQVLSTVSGDGGNGSEMRFADWIQPQPGVSAVGSLLERMLAVTESLKGSTWEAAWQELDWFDELIINHPGVAEDVL